MSRARRASAIGAFFSLAVAVVFLAAPVWARWYVSPAPIAPGDTVAVYGAHRFSTPTGQSTIGVESFALPARVDRRYLLLLANGNADGSSRAATVSVTLNGKTIITAADLGSAYSATRLIQALEKDTLSVVVAGSAGAFADVSILEVADPTFPLFGPHTFVRYSGSPTTETFEFDAGAAAGSPFYMCVVNGRPDGTARASSATVLLNGQEVILPADLNQQVGGFVRTVTLLAHNVLEVRMTSIPRSELTLCFEGTDILAPRLTITAPAQNFVTRDATVSVTGTVQDETPTIVTVNGTAASRSGDGYSATANLTEGANTILVHAADAAGNVSDSTRNVIRDSQAPTVVLTSPANQSVTNNAQVTVAGTITDATVTTVNVNGTPVALDANHAFSIVMTATEGSNFFTVTATDQAGNSTSEARQVTLDTAAPVVTIDAPADQQITNGMTVTVNGTVTDATPVTLRVNGSPISIEQDGSFSTIVTLGTEGNNALTIVATDAATNHSDDSRTVIRDTQAPTLSVTGPVEGDFTKEATVHVTGTVLDATATTLEVNGVPTPLEASGAFDATVALTTEGPNVIFLRATDAGGNSTTNTRSIIRDTQAPSLELTAPADAAEFLTPTVTVTGTAGDASPFRITVNGAEVPVASGSFSTMLTLTEGSNVLTIVATDTATNQSTVIRNVVFVPREPGVHPDPSTTAPVLDRGIATSPVQATSFLYTATDPIQVGVPAGTINAVRGSNVRGRVLNAALQPLQGVKVSVRDHPELGYTLSRMDGAFDLVVNGGLALSFDFGKAGYLSAQRTVNVPWQAWPIIDDVILLQVDPAFTQIALNSAATQIHRATVQSDPDGPRQVTAIFDPGTTATMTLANGTIVPMTTLTVRATEFTAGENGPRQMPAELPVNSAYTYAMQLTADEAMAAGAVNVTLSKPVSVYLENFLDIPVGTPVPVGNFEAAKAAWVAQNNGVVLSIVNVDNGVAAVDVTGDGVPESDATLTAMGIDLGERQKLATTYTAGYTLWRFTTPSFFPNDANFQGRVLGVDPTGDVTQACTGVQVDPIKCDIQVARRDITVTGMTSALHYGSNRSTGGISRSINVKLTGATVPADLQKVQLRVNVGGRGFLFAFQPQANLTFPFTWDGRDAFGRMMQGNQRAEIVIEHIYPVEYQKPSTAVPQAFAENCSITTGGAPACTLTAVMAPASPRKYWPRRQVLETTFGGFDAGGLGLGGFTMGSHHVYDPTARTIYQGDGSSRSGKRLPDIITTVAGKGPPQAYSGDGGPALNASLAGIGGLAVAPDGSIYFNDNANFRIRKVSPDGIITTVAGNGIIGRSGDENVPATTQSLWFGMGVAPTKDGGFLLFGGGEGRIRKVDRNGIIKTIAGKNGVAGVVGDGGPANNAAFRNIADVIEGPDGSIYVADRDQGRIRKINPAGIVSTIAGGGPGGCADGPGQQVAVSNPESVDLGPDGTVYWREWSGCNATPNGYRIRKLRPDGYLETLGGGAGTNQENNPCNGCTIVNKRLDFLGHVRIANDGTLYFHFAGSLWRLKGNVMYFVGGLGGFNSPIKEGNAFAKEPLEGLSGWDFGPDGAIYLGVNGNVNTVHVNRIRRVSPPLPGIGVGETAIASDNGLQLYVFDPQGRHLRTLDALSGNLIQLFSYDANGRLVTVTDKDGRLTTIERDAAGSPLAFVAPNGERTEVGLDANGYMQSVTGPLGIPQALTFNEDGLLTAATDFAGVPKQYNYQDGKLVSTTGAQGTLGMTVTGTSLAGQVAFSTPGSHSTSMGFTLNPDGSQTQISILPNGRTVTTVIATTGTRTTTYPDGRVEIEASSPDPRYASQSPLKADTLRMPSGLSRGRRLGRGIVLSNPLDVNSMVQQIDSTITNGRVHRDIFDRPSRTLTRITPVGRQRYTKLDLKGRVVEEGTSGLLPIFRQFDAAGHLLNETQGSVSNTNTYDAEGRRRTAADALGRTVTYDYDAGGRMFKKTLPDTRIIQWGFDATGNVTSFTPPERPAYLLTYSAANQMQTFTAPDAGDGPATTTTTFNAEGQLTRVDRPDGRSVVYGYDNFGRQNLVTIGRGSYQYAYNGTTGRLQTITAPDGGTVTHTYDGALLTRTTWGGAVSGDVRTTFDADFRPLTQNINGLNSITFGYDNDGLLTSTTGYVITRSPANGTVTGTTLGNITTTQGISPLGRFASMAVNNGAAQLFSVALTHDNVGRVATKTETVAGITSTYEYGYDPVDRLTTVIKDGATLATYTYDANGNRTNAVDASGSTSGSYDAQDRLTSYGAATFTYTRAGERATMVTSAGTTTYTYDELGNLVTVILPGGARIDYVIDGENRRIGRRLNGVLQQRWLYAGSQVVAELDAAGNVTRFVYATRGNVPDYMTKAGVTYRIIADANGSVRSVINSVTGVAAQRMEYDAFGRVAVDSNPSFQPFGYAGGLYDRDTKLVRLGVRDYDATIGRWTAKEPLKFDNAEPNLYTYASNDPINQVDVDGRFGFLTEQMVTIEIQDAIEMIKVIRKDVKEQMEALREFAEEGTKEANEASGILSEALNEWAAGDGTGDQEDYIAEVMQIYQLEVAKAAWQGFRAAATTQFKVYKGIPELRKKLSQTCDKIWFYNAAAWVPGADGPEGGTGRGRTLSPLGSYSRIVKLCGPWGEGARPLR